MAKNKIIFGDKVLIDLTSDTVTPETLLQGITAHDKSGEIITGTYSGESVTTQIKTVTPQKIQQTVRPDAGYDYLSSVVVESIPYTETENAAGGITATIA